jgi:1-acyl-sn-glycerol-3-phosphate acyltransferase
MLKKLLQPAFAIYVLVTFILSVLLAFPIILLLSLPDNLSGRKAIQQLLRYWSAGWLWMLGMPVKTSGYKPGNSHYVIVANHISYLDTLVIFPAVQHYFKALGKKEITKIPLVGFIYRQIVILVDRSSPASRANSMKLMLETVKSEANVIVFAEGTFNETPAPLKSFYDGAFRLAINAQTPILPLILPDTVNRWHYSGWWKLWPGNNRAVFLEPVEVAGLTEADLGALKQRVYTIMDEALRQYNSYPAVPAAACTP